jgi:hypothetical protein
MTGTSPPLYALSVRQPWAWLIVHGFKDFENRDWTPRYIPRQFVKNRAPFRCLIHASKVTTCHDTDSALAVLRTINRRRQDAGLELIELPLISMLERGGIIGSVEVLGWSQQPPERNPWAFGSGLLLGNAEAMPFTPCKGALGFFLPNRATMPGFAEGHAPHFIETDILPLS